MEKGVVIMKCVFFEFGGKLVNIVLDDVNLDFVLMGVLVVCFYVGQGCGILIWMLVFKVCYEEIVVWVKGIM